MRRQDIRTREQVVCIEVTNVSVDDVDVAVPEKREVGDISLMDVCDRWPYIAEFVGRWRIEHNAETFTHYRLVIIEAQMDEVHIIGFVLRFTAISIESPAHAWIPLATFNEQIDPLGPLPEIGDEHDQPLVHLDKLSFTLD